MAGKLLHRITEVLYVQATGDGCPAPCGWPLRGSGFLTASAEPDAAGDCAEKGYIEVDARFRKLQPPTRFGPEYLTYVLWAITPEGRATNLGEVQYDGSN